jgi:hypothetical protein
MLAVATTAPVQIIAGRRHRQQPVAQRLQPGVPRETLNRGHRQIGHRFAQIVAQAGQ